MKQTTQQLDGITDAVYVSQAHTEDFHSEFRGGIAYIEIKDNSIDKDQAVYLINRLKEVFDIKD